MNEVDKRFRTYLTAFVNTKINDSAAREALRSDPEMSLAKLWAHALGIAHATRSSFPSYAASEASSIISLPLSRWAFAAEMANGVG